MDLISAEPYLMSALGWLPAAISLGMKLFGGGASRRAQQRQAQQQADLDQRRQSNLFESQHGGRFGERAAWRNRYLGNMADAYVTKTYGPPDDRRTYKVLDNEKLHRLINKGGFGEQLRGSTPESVRSRVDFSSPKYQAGTSFLGDVLTGLGGAGGVSDILGKIDFFKK